MSDSGGYDGPWADGGERGGSPGAFAFHIGDAKIFDKHASEGGGITRNIGPAGETQQIDAANAIAFKATNTVISAPASAPYELHKITGGVNGDEIVIRKAPGGQSVTVKNTAHIACDDEPVLGDNMSIKLCCVSPNLWSHVK